MLLHLGGLGCLRNRRVGRSDGRRSHVLERAAHLVDFLTLSLSLLLQKSGASLDRRYLLLDARLLLRRRSRLLLFLTCIVGGQRGRSVLCHVRGRRNLSS